MDVCTIGLLGADHLTITVLGRMHPEQDDFWDGNWLISPITVAVGGFTGSVAAGLRIDELAAFRRGLEKLHADLDGEARLDSMETWIHLSATADDRGHITVKGDVMDRPGIGNTLSFELELDQSYLPDIIAALASIEQRYPVLGQR